MPIIAVTETFLEIEVVMKEPAVTEVMSEGDLETIIAY